MATLLTVLVSTVQRRGRFCLLVCVCFVLPGSVDFCSTSHGMKLKPVCNPTSPKTGAAWCLLSSDICPREKFAFPLMTAFWTPIIDGARQHNVYPDRLSQPAGLSFMIPRWRAARQQPTGPRRIWPAGSPPCLLFSRRAGQARKWAQK